MRNEADVADGGEIAPEAAAAETGGHVCDADGGSSSKAGKEGAPAHYYYYYYSRVNSCITAAVSRTSCATGMCSLYSVWYACAVLRALRTSTR